MKTLNWYGDIGEYEEINAKRTAQELEDAGGEDIRVHLHSYGGDVLEARTIYQQLRDYSGEIEIVLGGAVASAGTTISLGASPGKLIANDDTSYMIHNAQALAYGDFRVMADMAKELRAQNKIIAEKLSERKNVLTSDEIIEMMNATTWLYGQEIVDSGFADSLKQTGQNLNKDSAIANAKIKIAASMKKMAMQKSAPIQNTKEEDELMTNKEAVDFLKKEMTTPEIANAFGIKRYNKDDVELLKNLKEEGIDDPISEIKNLKDKISANDDEIRKAKITAAYGKKGTEEEPNPERDYAEKVLANVAVDKMDEEIQNLAKDSVMKTIAAKRADGDSELNLIEDKDKEPEAPKIRVC